MPEENILPSMSLQLAALHNAAGTLKHWRKLGMFGNLAWGWHAPGDSPLHYAARAGDTATVESLLSAGASLSAENELGHTALWIAARAGHVNTVQTLMRHRTEDGELPDGDDAIVATRSVVVVRAVLAIAPLAAMGRAGAKALKQVAREGHIEMVECLLEAGANPNGGDEMEWVYPDPDPNSWEAPGDRALHWAARAGQTMAVQLLINGGASLTTLNRRAESALEAAAKAGESTVVKLLLTSGAECEDGQETLDQVKRALRDTRCFPVAQMLAEAIVHLDGGGDMVWIMACEGRPLILEALVNAGAYLNAHLLNGWTPLHAAVRNCHFRCVDLLLRGGADVNAKDKTGRTPLHDAAEQGNSACIQVLLSGGARRGSRDRQWKTPRDYTADASLRVLLSQKRMSSRGEKGMSPKVAKKGSAKTGKRMSSKR
ncbi:hypothetical protein R5R35_000476 [Gryllus longicercus]|uniref:Uncharacterized protein n=1 Tax=Gryllus longicercus TaxID=2509291 RepID=A0AAN9VMQ6_9ORTH